MNDVRPFEEYKEIIKDMRKETMIRGLYDLSARVIRQENIIKEVREYIEKNYDDYEEFIYGKEFKEKILKMLGDKNNE